MLLFGASQLTPADADCSFWYSSTRPPSYPAGLYLNRPNAPQDECTLILPFRIGSNGFVRQDEGTRFTYSSHHQVYRPGYVPCCGSAEQTLLNVLESWRGMVERGDSAVDGNGVAGGMEKWKEADEEGMREGYVLPVLEG